MRTARRLVKDPGMAKTSKKAVCIIGGESEALGFHQETTGESRNNKIGFV